MSPIVGHLLDEPKTETSHRVRIIHSGLNDPNLENVGRLLHLYPNVIVVRFDHEADGVLVGAQSSVSDGVRRKLADSEAGVIGSAQQLGRGDHVVQ